MDDLRVSIVILNWNGWKDTLECLDSLWEINYSNYDIIIVDNDSYDDSVLKIRKYIELVFDTDDSLKKHFEVKETSQMDLSNDEPDDSTKNEVTIIKARENLGFSCGNNLGIEYALKFTKPDYILLLNNDTVVKDDFLNGLLAPTMVYEGVGVVGPKTCYFPEKDYINSAGAQMKWPLGIAKNRGIGELDQGQYDESREVDSVLGACMLIRSHVIEEVGMLDSNFFLMLEETDFCLRVGKAGYKIFYQPSSIVYHKEGFSARLSQISLYYSYRNRILLLKKHVSLSKRVIYSNLIFFRALMDAITFWIRGDWKLSGAVIRGCYAGWKF